MAKNHKCQETIPAGQELGYRARECRVLQMRPVSCQPHLIHSFLTEHVTIGSLLCAEPLCSMTVKATKAGETSSAAMQLSFL